MSRSARVEKMIEAVNDAGLTSAERAELAEELLLEGELKLGQKLLDDVLAEIGPLPQDEVDRLRREWPRV
jgi:hypothetical protein